VAHVPPPAAEGAQAVEPVAVAPVANGAEPGAATAATPPPSSLPEPAALHEQAPKLEEAHAALQGHGATEPVRVAKAMPDTNTRARLLKRIDSLEDSVPDLVERGRVKSPDAMLKMLTKYRQEAELAPDAEARRDIGKKLNSLESMFIKPAGR
ncbi:hypothetical protein LZ198_18605, partial [Myxococcus sp. K15C18031901]|nr:hypothetical protein [Myxococcus dinghuensis]